MVGDGSSAGIPWAIRFHSAGITQGTWSAHRVCDDVCCAGLDLSPLAPDGECPGRRASRAANGIAVAGGSGRTAPWRAGAFAGARPSGATRRVGRAVRCDGSGRGRARGHPGAAGAGRRSRRGRTGAAADIAAVAAAALDRRCRVVALATDPQVGAELEPHVDQVIVGAPTDRCYLTRSDIAVAVTALADPDRTVLATPAVLIDAGAYSSAVSSSRPLDSPSSSCRPICGSCTPMPTP